MFLIDVALIAGRSGAIEIESHHRVPVGIAHVKHLAIGRERDAIGPRLPLRDNFQIAFRRDVPDAVKIEIAAIVRAAESRIGEINVAVSANHNVVRRVEFLALIALGQRFDFALQVQPRHAAGLRFADVQTPLQIVGEAGSAAIVVSQYLRMRDRNRA